MAHLGYVLLLVHCYFTPFFWPIYGSFQISTWKCVRPYKGGLMSTFYYKTQKHDSLIIPPSSHAQYLTKSNMRQACWRSRNAKLSFAAHCKLDVSLTTTPVWTSHNDCISMLPGKHGSLLLTSLSSEANQANNKSIYSSNHSDFLPIAIISMVYLHTDHFKSRNM